MGYFFSGDNPESNSSSSTDFGDLPKVSLRRRALGFTIRRAKLQAGFTTRGARFMHSALELEWRIKQSTNNVDSVPSDKDVPALSRRHAQKPSDMRQQYCQCRKDARRLAAVHISHQFYGILDITDII